VKACEALVPPAFVAVKLIAYDGFDPAAGVPLRAPVVVLNVTPVGRVPVSAYDVGDPLAVTWNIPAVPTVKVVLARLEITGAVTVAGFTVRVKACEALVPPAFVAVKLIAYDGFDPAAGVPLRAPVVVLNVTPVGRVPVSAYDVGDPLAVTWNIPAVPTVKVVFARLEITGAVTATFAPSVAIPVEKTLLVCSSDVLVPLR
jgi:hypothetical protein